MTYLEELRFLRRAKPATSHPSEPTPIWDSNLIWNRIQSGEVVRIWSTFLWEWVLWVRDEEVRARGAIQYPGVVSYTVAELEHLIATKSREHLRAIHEAKKIFGSEAQVVGAEKASEADQEVPRK